MVNSPQGASRDWRKRPCKDGDPCANCEVGYGGGCQDPAQGGPGYEAPVAPNGDVCSEINRCVNAGEPVPESLAARAVGEIAALRAALMSATARAVSGAADGLGATLSAREGAPTVGRQAASSAKMALADLRAYRAQHKRASTAHGLGLKEADCEVCMLLAEAERLREYAHMASGYLSQRGGFTVCPDCKLAHLECKMRNPGCGFEVCPACYEYRFSPAAGFGVQP